MRKATEEKYKEICRLFGEGRTREQIAEETNYSKSTVDRILQRYGNMLPRDAFQDHKEEALTLWENGVTIKDIAERTGLSVTTISRNLRKLGKRRGRGGRKREDIPLKELAGQKREKEGSAGYAGRRLDPEAPEPVPTQYAKNTRRSMTVVVRGKAYQDVTEWYL